MPIVRRRIVALITIACLGASLPAVALTQVAHAQGAGDQQYQDPFDSSTTSGSNSGSSHTSRGSSGSSSSGSSTTGMGTLSATPQGSASGSSASSAPSSTGSSTTTGSTSGATATSPAATSSGLPNTGADARLVLAVGAILVLAGLGLRLRSAPERF